MQLEKMSISNKNIKVCSNTTSGKQLIFKIIFFN